MTVLRRWLRVIRRSFSGSSCRSINVTDSTIVKSENPAADTMTEEADLLEEIRTSNLKINEHLAAMKIQACFRGHLGRRAFRALRSLVKVQGMVRGVHRRRQFRIAFQCMQAMVRLSVRIQARMSKNDFNQISPKNLQLH